MGILKKIFCKHDYEYVRKIEEYCNLNGDMIYKRCKKCGKLSEEQNKIIDSMLEMLI